MKRLFTAVALGLSVLVAQGAATGGDKGTVVTLDDLKSAAPPSWKEKEGAPAFKTRLYTFIVPKASGDDKDAELQVIFFGKGSGGGMDENIKRWKGMFEAPEGKKIDDLTKVEKFKVGKVDVTTVDVQGTYLDKFPPFAPNAKTIRRPDYRRVNVYFDSENGPFFFILVGPAKTVAQHKKDFDQWVKNFK